MNAHDHAEKARQFKEFSDECAAIGLGGAVAAIDRAIEYWNAAEVSEEGGIKKFSLNKATMARVQNNLSQATSRVPDDLKSCVILILDQRRLHLYEDSRPFGDDVFLSFPLARGDIEDAAKCLAVERATACVFHLMRALESAVKIIAEIIEAAVEDEHGRGLGWGVIANNMKPKIDAMPRGSKIQIRWYRVQHELEVINRAWRVPTNHPKESYSVEEAQEIFDATRAFMRDLASLSS